MIQKELWDCHMHSSFSADSDTPMEEMIQESIRRGLSGICFTEHLDPDYPETPDNVIFDLDIPSYRKQLFRLREKYHNQLQIHYGIELGLQPHLAEQFLTLLGTEPFDFVIGSSHTVHGKDPYYPDYYVGRDEYTSYLEYFESILENINAFSSMDTYGHLDYVVRYGPNRNQNYSYSQYHDILDEILTQLIHKNIALEVNTGGYAKGLGEPNPCKDILLRYRELGGESLTIGADAHRPDQIAYSFDAVFSLIKECGFQYYTVFSERKPVFLPIL